MSLINYASREINCKIVYYGTGLGGKTTNLEHVYSKVNPDAKGKMISLATETERTLFFDFLPIDLGEVKGFKTRFHLYTVPGQVYYNASRKLILNSSPLPPEKAPVRRSETSGHMAKVMGQPGLTRLTTARQLSVSAVSWTRVPVG